jgi:hypothetical protein
MKKKYYLLIITFFLIYQQNIYCQDAFDFKIDELKKSVQVPYLSQEQMCQDFDTLLSIIEQNNPHIQIRKIVTEYDIIEELKSYRSDIIYIHNTFEFAVFIDKILDLMLDQHCSIATNIWWFQDYYKKEISINKITETDMGINFCYSDTISKNISMIHLKYINGNYFTKYPIWLVSEKDSILIPSFSQILECNKANINDIQSLKRTANCRWDFEKRQYYSENFVINTLTSNEIKVFCNGKENIFVFNKFYETPPTYNSEDLFNLNFHYFSQDSVLYFKLPMMSYSKKNIQELQKQLQKYKKQNIKSVIIDIRGNYGGNDLAWQSLLSLLIDEDLQYDLELITKKSPSIYKRYKSNGYKNFDFGTFSTHVKSKEKIQKHRKSLNYKGDIFLLIDDDIFSSAMNFASISEKNSKIKTIGTYNGRIGGFGLDPIVFILPNSRFYFTLDVTLDATDVNLPIDFYHNKINFPLIPTLEYYRYYIENGNEINEKNMYENDIIFRYAIEFINR